MTSLRFNVLNAPQNGANEKTPSAALVAACLAQTDTRALAKALAADTPMVGLITTASPAWSKVVAAEFNNLYDSQDNVMAIKVADSKRDGNDWIADHLRNALGAGNHVVICCHDPAVLLPAIVAASVDVRVDMPEVNAAILRHAVKSLTGLQMRGTIDTGICKLDVPELSLVLRNGTKPTDILRRLRQMAAAVETGKPVKMSTNTSPLITELPLPASLSDWAEEMVADLRAISNGTLSAGQLRFGVLEGEPGTGKTLIAGAIARSAGWDFNPVSIGAWFNHSDGNLGGVSKACVAYFDTLLAQDYVVGLIDEIDALPDRQTLEPRDRQWWTTVINLVLTQIDRLRNSGKSVMLLAATNYYDRLDGALVRAGRLEQRITVVAPSSEDEIAAIFAHYTRGEVDPDAFAAVAPFAVGATPAQIAGWVRQARAAARKAERHLLLEDVMAAVVPLDLRNSAELLAVAQHEAGHAVIARVLGLDVGSVSIIAAGGTGGVTMIGRGSSYPNLAEVEDQATALLGGRAADIVLGQKGAHTGAARDLDMATSLLTRAVSQWGLYDSLIYSSANTPGVSSRVGERLEALLRRAIGLVDLNRAAVESLADALVTKRLLQADEIGVLINSHLMPETPRHAELD